MRSHYTTEAIVYCQWYTTDSGYKKSWYYSTGAKYFWHFKPQSINKTIDLAMFWKVFVFHTDETADILEWYRLKIDEKYYDVKWVAEFKWITFNNKQILLNAVDNW